MSPDSGTRLCLLFEAGQARYALEATSVVEVSPPDSDGDRLRGLIELTDLSALLGGEPEERPGLAVVLDVSPTLAVRVRKVVEVADVARAPFFMLPPGLGQRLGSLVRGAFLYREHLFLELAAEALGHRRGGVGEQLDRPLHLLEATPERALVFESRGKLYGLPLSWVLQVVGGEGTFAALPAPSGGVTGLLAHGQALWPVYALQGLMGEEPGPREQLFVLAELAGQHVGFCASRVLGVHPGLSRTDRRGELMARGLPGPALFLDLQRMFS